MRAGARRRQAAGRTGSRVGPWKRPGALGLAGLGRGKGEWRSGPESGLAGKKRPREKKKRAGLGHEESGPGERVGLVSWVFPNGLVWVSRFGFWVSLTFSISIPKQTKFEFKQI